MKKRKESGTVLSKRDMARVAIAVINEGLVRCGLSKARTFRNMKSEIIRLNQLYFNNVVLIQLKGSGFGKGIKLDGIFGKMGQKRLKEAFKAAKLKQVEVRKKKETPKTSDMRTNTTEHNADSENIIDGVQTVSREMALRHTSSKTSVPAAGESTQNGHENPLKPKSAQEAG